MEYFLSTEDSLKAKRIEMLLGTPMLVDGSMIRACPPDLPKLGISAIQTVSEEVFYFQSTLKEVLSMEDSILTLLFRSKRTFQKYTLFCIHKLISLGEDVMRYIYNMPSPTYQYARYTDWILHFMITQENSNKDTDFLEDPIQDVRAELERYIMKFQEEEIKVKEEHKMRYNLSDEELDTEVSFHVEKPAQEPQEENISNILEKDDEDCIPPLIYTSFPRPYVIRKVLEEKEILVKSTATSRIVISELECEWTWAKPMGEELKTQKFLDYYLQRKKNISLWDKPATSSAVKNQSALKNIANEPMPDIKSGLGSSKFEEEKEENSGLKPIGEEEDEEMEGGNPENSEEDDTVNQDLNDRANDGYNPDIKDDYYGDGNQKEHDNKIDDYNNNDEQFEGLDETIYGTEGAIPINREKHPNQHIEDQAEKDEENIIGQEPVNGLEFKRSAVVLRLSVYNYNQKSLKSEITIKPLCFAPNFFVPICSLKAEVPKNKTKAVAYFHKIHPTRPFGKYEFEAVTNEAEIQAEEQQPQEEPQNDQGAAVGVGTGTTGDNFEWPNEDANEFEGMQDEINCSACTMLNPITAINCSICGTKLPHRV